MTIVKKVTLGAGDTVQTRKERIENLYNNISTLQAELKEIVRPYVEKDEDMWFIDFICIPHWDCEKSPVGWCVYNKEKDAAWDNCIFCGLAYERK